MDEQPRKSGPIRKTAVAIVGGTLTAAGVVMLVTPGPGIITIAGGLAILSTEFRSARRALDRVRERLPNSEE